MNHCPNCSLNEWEQKQARDALRDYMDVPKKYQHTTSDFRSFDIVVCKHCGAPQKLVKEVSLLETVMLLRRLALHNLMEGKDE